MVVKLCVRWIRNLWRETRGFGRRTEGAQAPSMASGGWGRANREKGRERENGRGVGGRDVLAFNSAYGMAREGWMAGTWRRPTILGHGTGETECVADRMPLPMCCLLYAQVDAMGGKDVRALASYISLPDALA